MVEQFESKLIIAPNFIKLFASNINFSAMIEFFPTQSVNSMYNHNPVINFDILNFRINFLSNISFLNCEAIFNYFCPKLLLLNLFEKNGIFYSLKI